MKSVKLLTVFARREITTDSATKDLHRVQNQPEAVSQHLDVQVYRDRQGRRPFARFAWWMVSRPTKRNHYITLNCYRGRLRWI